MAKKQTRRSISLEEKLYCVTFDRARALNTSMAEYVSGLIRAELKSAGIEPPPAKHANRGFSDGIASNREARKAKAAADGKAKYEQALDRMRQKIAETPAPSESTTEPIKPNECWWCGDTFKAGEIPTDVHGNKLHGKCKREIARLPAGVEPWPAR
jgi:hypothetical protein